MKLSTAIKNQQEKIAVVGLGYVGLPLALAFGKQVPTIGFDTNKQKIQELKQAKDASGEISEADIKASHSIEFTTDSSRLREAKCIIVTVPTPITTSKQPDLTCIREASKMVGTHLVPGSIVVYESTVYPGVTEEICKPILENHSGLQEGKDFKIAYSPERINPGDKTHTLENIIKVVSASDSETLEEIAEIYAWVVKAGIFKAASIKTAEAAKVIENTQRDLNIALVNELAIVFNHMGMDSSAVLEAAATKWNFIPMTPGLVGGHCIGVDPYYLTYRAEELGYHPHVILAGRRINDGMGKYIAEQTIKQLILSEKKVKKSKILVLGITFKENVTDIRNSKVMDVVRELEDYGAEVFVADPYADKASVKHEYGIDLIDYNEHDSFDALVVTVNHRSFKEWLSKERLQQHLCQKGSEGVVIDVKGLFRGSDFTDSGIAYWRL